MRGGRFHLVVVTGVLLLIHAGGLFLVVETAKSGVQRDLRQELDRANEVAALWREGAFAAVEVLAAHPTVRAALLEEGSPSDLIPFLEDLLGRVPLFERVCVLSPLGDVRVSIPAEDLPFWREPFFRRASSKAESPVWEGVYLSPVFLSHKAVVWVRSRGGALLVVYLSLDDLGERLRRVGSHVVLLDGFGTPLEEELLEEGFLSILRRGDGDMGRMRYQGRSWYYGISWMDEVGLFFVSMRPASDVFPPVFFFLWGVLAVGGYLAIILSVKAGEGRVRVTGDTVLRPKGEDLSLLGLTADVVSNLFTGMYGMVKTMLGELAQRGGDVAERGVVLARELAKARAFAHQVRILSRGEPGDVGVWTVVSLVALVGERLGEGLVRRLDVISDPSLSFRGSREYAAIALENVLRAMFSFDEEAFVVCRTTRRVLKGNEYTMVSLYTPAGPEGFASSFGGGPMEGEDAGVQDPGILLAEKILSLQGGFFGFRGVAGGLLCEMALPAGEDVPGSPGRQKG